jgi:hypothetical protein
MAATPVLLIAAVVTVATFGPLRALAELANFTCPNC